MVNIHNKTNQTNFWCTENNWKCCGRFLCKWKHVWRLGWGFLSKYDGKITDVHLDFFELFSPIEYEIFLDDPEADIPESAKENFVNAIQMLEDHGHRDFSSFISTFVLATPGTRTDSAVAKILKAANLKDYFEKPQDATRFVKSIFNTLYKNLEFEGFQMFGLWFTIVIV